MHCIKRLHSVIFRYGKHIQMKEEIHYEKNGSTCLCWVNGRKRCYRLQQQEG